MLVHGVYLHVTPNMGVIGLKSTGLNASQGDVWPRRQWSSKERSANESSCG